MFQTAIATGACCSTLPTAPRLAATKCGGGCSHGNYWSDNPSFDLNGDGIADSPYRPNDLIDTVLWTAPLAKVLTNSPAVQIIRWAQSQFPAILPGGVVDSRPLMTPPRRASQEDSP